MANVDFLDANEDTEQLLEAWTVNNREKLEFSLDVENTCCLCSDLRF